MRLTRWTDNHEVKSRGSCCGLLRDQPVHGAKIFNRNAGTYSCLPNQTVWTNVFARCGATKWQRWGQREEATTASLLQAGCNTGRYFHITPTKHNYGRNKFASITKQPELHNWAGGGRWSPPTQQARPVPSLQTALPYLVKGGAQQNKFRSSLLSRYERFTKEITPPPSMFFSNVSANADHPCNFTSYIHPSRLSRRPTEWIHATYMSYGTWPFSLPIMFKLGTEFACWDVKLHCTPRQYRTFPYEQRISILIQFCQHQNFAYLRAHTKNTGGGRYRVI